MVSVGFPGSSGRRDQYQPVEAEQLRRSIAMLAPGARDAIGREDALRLLAELGDVQGRLDDLKRRRELAEEG
jgi:hypothetical protein